MADVTCTPCSVGNTTAQAGSTAASDCKRYVCALRFRPAATAAGLGLYLNLAEVQLYDRGGALVPRPNLTFTLSSTYVDGAGVPYAASYCNDGNTRSVVTLVGGATNTGPGQVCASGAGDGYPFLWVQFNCSLVPARAVVHNRIDSAAAAARIASFSLDANDVRGRAVYTYNFSGSSANYSVALPLP